MAILEKLVVQDYRNIALAELEFSANINCISGGSGEGKTNLLDAIWYMSMTKSAFRASDRDNFRYGADGFSLSGTYLMQNALRSRFSIKVTSKGEKTLYRSCSYPLPNGKYWQRNSDCTKLSPCKIR